MALMSMVYGVEDSPNHSLQCNMMHMYDEIQKNGREIREDQAIAAVGGSLIYRSAYLNGFSVGSLEDIYDFKIISRFVLQDFDDEKVGVQADSKVFTLDLLKGFSGASNMYIKTRFAHVVGDDNTIAGNGILKLDPSYNEIRLELNYLF